MGSIEGTSAAPSDYALSLIEVLAKRVPPAAEEVRALVNELTALNNMMLDAKIPYIQPPGFGGGGGGRGRPPEDDDDMDRMDP
jgi:hypothetical protein